MRRNTKQNEGVLRNLGSAITVTKYGTSYDTIANPTTAENGNLVPIGMVH